MKTQTGNVSECSEVVENWSQCCAFMMTMINDSIQTNSMTFLFMENEDSLN